MRSNISRRLAAGILFVSSWARSLPTQQMSTRTIRMKMTWSSMPSLMSIWLDLAWTARAW